MSFYFPLVICFGFFSFLFFGGEGSVFFFPIFSCCLKNGDWPQEGFSQIWLQIKQRSRKSRNTAKTGDMQARTYDQNMAI